MDKLKTFFNDMIVYKNQKSNFFKTLKLPSFLRDWVLKKFANEDGTIDENEALKFIKTYIPEKEKWTEIRNRIVTDYERTKILTKISARANIKDQTITFTLPNLALMHTDTFISNAVWDESCEPLVHGKETWGVVTLGYLDKELSPDKSGKIQLLDFADFCPYTVDIDYYKKARTEFSTDEWLDVLLGAIDYNATGYKNETEKLTMLFRLLPFVEKNLNLIELAPKGTGKSYVFGHISHYGVLEDGGRITRAKMFYDATKKTAGFIEGNDFVAIDEVKLVQFSDVNEMRSILQGYMEYGTFNFNGYEGKSDAGIVFLGNISSAKMDETKNMFSELPELFRESALLDRVHGFIKGWDIPRMNDDMKMNGWAMNTEYFSSILHLLRADITYRRTVDALIKVPPKSDTRHTEAVKKIATALLKLLFPNVSSPKDISKNAFEHYCLFPAVNMRSIIQKQLAILDEEYETKKMPDFSINDVQGNTVETEQFE